MLLPTLNSRNVKVNMQYISDFMGINRLDVIQPNEFSSIKNCGTQHYPCLSPRMGRKLIEDALPKLESVAAGSECSVYCFDGKIAAITNHEFYYDGVRKAALNREYPKQLAYMNKYIVIFPDKIYYDTINDVIKPMEITYTDTTSGQFTFKDDRIIFNSGELPAFEIGDGIIIEGCADTPYNNRSFIITAIGSNYLQADSNTFEAVENEKGLVTLKRTIPDLKYIIEFNNRLWGCDEAGTIYCSKLGSFNNFNYYPGLATDSYYTEVGSEGNFTGIAAYNGKLYFFKEDIIHAIYGYMPSNFQTVDISSLGVLEGAYKSIAVTNNLLFYVSRDGVMVFDGTMPELISKKLGDISYSEAAAGGNRQYYYLCVNNNGLYEVYVYDSDNNFWTMQDNTHINNFATYKGKMLYLDYDTNTVQYVDDTDSTEQVEWEAVTGDINLLNLEKFSAITILLRIELKENSTLHVAVKRNNGEWMHKKTFTGCANKDVFVPIAPMRCESFQIKFSGTGPCKIYSISRKYTERSNV